MGRSSGGSAAAACEPIAIVGAAARLPGAPDLDGYWDLLAAGRDAVTEVPDGRWSKRFFHHPDPRQPGKSYTWAAGVLPDIAGFDAGFFGMSPREADQVDPQQRLLLELAWEALEDAGIPSRRIAGSGAGVYIGFSSAEYANIRMGDPSWMDAYFMTGTTASIAANRISYVFDLHGPSFVVDTACSSSLVALAQACKALVAGEVPLALAGAANLLLSPYPYIGFCRASMLSPTGRCHAFDARADGYVRAEGAGIVVLKRLVDAERDGDPIRGVILAAGVNSDGRTVGLSLPNRAAQAALLRETYAAAGVAPDDLAFVEAHGTGTAAGDPIEVGALGEVLGRARSAPLPIGSAKTNVGHLETASGMAGLFKAMLALERRTLPASLHFESPNPGIDFEALNVCVAAEQTPLALKGRLVAGINSFGFGGTNAHVVLASGPATPVTCDDSRLPPLLISARSQAALEDLAQSWAAQLTETAAPAALVRGAARRRDHHRHRLWLRGETPEALAEALNDDDSRGRIAGEAVSGDLAFVFSGNGSQWAGMGAEALKLSPAFRAGVALADAALFPWLGWSALARLEGKPDGQDLARTDQAQPLLFAVQVGIVEALRAEGVEARWHMGHSVGEIAAAWASGALSLDAAAHVVAARSRGQQRTCGMGRMAAVGASAEACQAVLDTVGGGAVIAAVNSAASVTVAGDLADLEQVEAEALRHGWLYRLLDLDYPFHTAAMDRLKADLMADLGELQAGTSPAFVSTVTGAAAEGPLDAAYWWRNIREPVVFGPAVNRLAEAGARIFLEIGPAAILQGYLREGLREAGLEGAVLGSLGRRPPASDPFPELAGALYARGYDLAASPAFDGPAPAHGLPRHPWARTSHWSGPTAERIAISAPAEDHPLLGYRWERDGRTWKALIDLDLHPWLADHAVEGVPVLPAAAVLELGLAAGRAIHGEATGLEVRDLEISRALVVEPGRPREMRLRVEPDGRFSLESRPRLGEDGWIVHASGRVLAGSGEPPPRPGKLAGEAADVVALYAKAARLGLDYGPAFRTLSDLRVAGTEAVVTFGGPGLGAGFLLAPNRVDGAFHALLGLAEGDGETLLPWRIAAARLYAPFGRTPASARVRLVHRGVRSIEGEALLVDAAGAPVAALTGCWFRRVRLDRKVRLEDRLMRMAYEPAPLDQRALSPAAELARAHPWDVTGDAADDSGPMLRAFLAASSVELVRELSGGPFWPAAVARPQAEPLLTSLLAELEAFGLAERGPAGWTLADGEGLGDPARIWGRILEDAPAMGPSLALAAAVVARTRRLVREGEAPALPAALVAQVLHRSGAGEAAAAVLTARVEAIAADWPRARPLRILEVGAASGGLARRLSRRLRTLGVTCRYVVTDAEPTEGVETAARPLADDSVFDLVLANQALSRVGGEPLARRLAPGGVLLACEPEPNPFWNLVFGAPDGATLLTGLRSAPVETLAAAPWSLRLTEAASPPTVVTEPAADVRGWAVLGAEADPLVSALQAQGLSTMPSLEGDAAIRLWAEGVTDLVVVGAGRPAESLAGLISAARAAREAGARFWIVTRGGWGAAPAAGASAGLTRTLMNEAPELDARVVDVDTDLAPAAAADGLIAELAAGSPEREVRLTRDGRQVVRLRRGGGQSDRTAPFVRLEAVEPGRLDALAWLGGEPPAPGAGEVTVEVKAAALNFRDLMWAMDLLPEEALADGFTGPTLGLECAGVVAGVGVDVEGFAPGDRVLAFAPGSLASHVRTVPQALVRLPDGLTFREAATLPVAYLTVLYALETVGRLSAGETVLVHGGAGGVGLAAIHYAQHVGARVIATAGSEAKREMLRLMGVEHVLDSRSLAFADEVRAICGGVDVVLNSLNGAAMERSLELVRPFGRFLELGKRDFFEDTRVGLRPLRRNVTWSAIDVDALPNTKPELAWGLLRRAVELVGQGVLRPLPYVRFGFSEATEAFRLMQAAGHIGKVVLTPDDPPAVLPAPVGPPIRADTTYLVTGGLSGFGLETARWLAARGARYLALLGRRGSATPGAAEAMAGLEADGVHVLALACDVADRPALARAMAEIEQAMPPLAGVVHAAMRLDDGLLFDLEAERIEAVLGAKLTGAENLDALTADAGLDFFVLYSSAVTLLGAPGQGSYVAANQALETLARRRRAEGRPALAVAWGPIADAGYLARMAETREALARRLAATPIPAAEALEALGVLLAGDEPVVAYAAVQWEVARRRLPILATPAYPADSGIAAEDASDVAEQLAGLDAAAALTLVTVTLTQEMGRILGCSPDGIDVRRPLLDLGMDSLMAVELRLAVEARLGVSLPLLALSDSTTLGGVAQRVIEAIGQAPADASGIAQAALRHEVEALPAAPGVMAAE